MLVELMPNNVPNPLQRAFDAKVVSIKDLIERTGFSRPTVKRHMTGETSPDAADREVYAKALGIEPAEFERLWFGDIRNLLTPEQIDMRDVVHAFDRLPKADRQAVAKAFDILNALPYAETIAGMTLGEVESWLIGEDENTAGAVPLPMEATRPRNAAYSMKAKATGKRRPT